MLLSDVKYDTRESMMTEVLNNLKNSGFRNNEIKLKRRFGEHKGEELDALYALSINEDTIRAKVKNKIENGAWDKGYKGQDFEELLTKQIFRYASDIRLLTNDKSGNSIQINGVDIDVFIADKLLSIDVIRFGDFKDKIDDDIIYDKFTSVTSEKYRGLNLGAATLSYFGKDEEGKIILKTAVALFDNKQGYNRGIDLNNDEDIEQTLVHEFTHVLSKVLEIKDMSQEICNGETFEHYNQKGNTIYADKFRNEECGRTFFNGVLVDQGVLYQGISTIEEKNGERIYHNEKDEAVVEGIARAIINSRGGQIIDPGRYRNGVILADVLFTEALISKDFNEDKERAIDTFVKFISEPQTIIHEMESKSIGNNDLLHYMSDSIKSFEESIKKIKGEFSKIIKPTVIKEFAKVMENYIFLSNDAFENYNNDSILNLNKYKLLIGSLIQGEKNGASEEFLNAILRNSDKKEDFYKFFGEALEIKEQLVLVKEQIKEIKNKQLSF